MVWVSFFLPPLVHRDCGIRRAWPQARQAIPVQVSRLLSGFCRCMAVGNKWLVEDLGFREIGRAHV